eukprot:11502136-Ditylum_brightwellii.AAC.1
MDNSKWQLPSLGRKWKSFGECLPSAVPKTQKYRITSCSLISLPLHQVPQHNHTGRYNNPLL